MTVIKITELRLVDKAKNTNKFYRLILTDKNTIRFEWGRIGKTPRSQTKDYGNLKNLAEHHYQAKMREKLAKGYSIYNQEDLPKITDISLENNVKGLTSDCLVIEADELFYD